MIVQFTDDSVPSATKWLWTFGDGTTSTEQNPIHTYPSAVATYSVSLAVENDFGSGSPDPLIKLNYIGVVDSSNADFSADTTSGTAPLVVNFTDVSSPVPTAWAWTFGDGGTSTAQNPSHTFAAGTWTVSLQATFAGGPKMVTKTGFIVVTPALCKVPDFTNTSSAAAQSTWGLAGFTTTVQFKQGGLPWTIKSQNLTGNSQVPCTSTIMVSKN